MTGWSGVVQVAVVKLAASGQRLQMRYTYIHTYVLMYMHTYMQRTLRWPPLTAVGFLLLTFRSFYYFGATVLNLNPVRAGHLCYCYGCVAVGRTVGGSAVGTLTACNAQQPHSCSTNAITNATAAQRAVHIVVVGVVIVLTHASRSAYNC